MAITVEQVERIAEKLRSLPPIENKKRVVSKQESIKLLTSEIAGLRERGYTLEQIAELLTADQLEIGAPTLKSYLQRAKPSSKARPLRNNWLPPKPACNCKQHNYKRCNTSYSSSHLQRPAQHQVRHKAEEWRENWVT